MILWHLYLNSSDSCRSRKAPAHAAQTKNRVPTQQRYVVDRRNANAEEEKEKEEEELRILNYKSHIYTADRENRVFRNSPLSAVEHCSSIRAIQTSTHSVFKRTKTSECH